MSGNAEFRGEVLDPPPRDRVRQVARRIIEQGEQDVLRLMTIGELTRSLCS